MKILRYFTASFLSIHIPACHLLLSATNLTRRQKNRGSLRGFIWSTGIDGKQTTRSFQPQDPDALGRYLWISWKILEGHVGLEVRGYLFDATSLIKRSDVAIFETSKALGCLPSCHINMCHTRTEALKQFQLISDVSNFTCLNAASIRMLEIGNLTSSSLM